VQAQPSVGTADDVDARLHEPSVAGLRDSLLAAQPSADSRHKIMEARLRVEAQSKWS